MWARFGRCAGAVAAAVAVAASGGPARAEGGPFGAGIILGEPSGLSLKLFVERSHAFDAAVSWSVLDSALYVHADYLLHLSGWVLRGGSNHRLLPYVGIGAKIAVEGDHDDRGHHGDGGLGLRVPLGLAWLPGSLPIDIFLEVAPGLFLLPDTDPDLDVGLGLRYFF